MPANLNHLLVLLGSPARGSLLFCVAAALMVASLGSGCVPRCRTVCDKLLECDEVSTDRVAHSECEDSCQRQSTIFAGWKNEDRLKEASDEQRRCIARSTCDEIADGACYDERLFQFDCPDCP